MSSQKNASQKLKFLIFALFIVGFPIMAVLSSKWGLDTYREIRSEMVLYKDSIQIPDFKLNTHKNQAISKESTNGKMLLVHFAPSLSDVGVKGLLGTVQPIQKIFNKEDKRKYLIISYTMDSVAMIKQEIEKISADTSNWKFIPLDSAQFFALRPQFRVNADSAATSLVLVDSKGKICDLYDTKNPKSMEKLQTHMAIVVPKKERKKIEYRADKDLYQ